MICAGHFFPPAAKLPPAARFHLHGDSAPAELAQLKMFDLRKWMDSRKKIFLGKVFLEKSFSLHLTKQSTHQQTKRPATPYTDRRAQQPTHERTTERADRQTRKQSRAD